MPSSRRISMSRRNRSSTTTGARPSESSSTSSSSGRHMIALAERQHLPLAAGQEPADAAPEVAELGKELIDQRLAPAPLGQRGAARDRRDEVLRHREIGEHLVALGHQHDAAPRVLVRRPVLDALALERDRALGDARVVEAEEARDRAQRRGLAGAVGAEQRDDLPGLDRQRDALHRGDGALIDHLELVDGEQASSARSRDRPMLERPQQEIALDAAPDADQPERLEDQEQDHHEAERGVVHREQQAGIALRARQSEQADLDRCRETA